jgi:hypothetical protein
MLCRSSSGHFGLMQLAPALVEMVLFLVHRKLPGETCNRETTSSVVAPQAVQAASCAGVFQPCVITPGTAGKCCPGQGFCTGSTCAVCLGMGATRCTVDQPSCDSFAYECCRRMRTSTATSCAPGLKTETYSETRASQMSDSFFLTE